MKWWLLLLLVPTVAGLPVLTEQELHAVHTVDLDQAKIHSLMEQANAGASCVEPLQRRLGDFGAQAPASDTGPYFHVLPDGNGFTFLEQDYENGCAELRVQMPVPAGTTVVTLTFNGDRSVSRNLQGGTQLTPPSFNQVVKIWRDPVADTVNTWQPQAQMQMFDEETGDAERIQHQLQEVLPAGTEFITIGWEFRDSTEASGEISVGAPTYGYRMRSQVTDIQVQFRMPLNDVTFAEDTVGYEQRERVIQTDVFVGIPAPEDGSYEASFRISNEYGVYAVETPAGLRVPSELLNLREAGGILTFTLPADVINTYGEGTYTVSFRSFQALEITGVIVPLLLAALVVPSLAGVFAQRSVVVAHRVAGRRMVALSAVALAVWVALGATFAVILVADLWPVMISVPLDTAGQIAYYFLGALSIAFIAVGVWAGRTRTGEVEKKYDEVERVKEDLERSNRDLEQFAFVASHDLKEPLRMVASYTELLQRRFGDELNETAREYVDYAAKGAARMGRMVDDLLVYARLHEQENRRADVNLEITMDLVRKQLHGLMDETGARVTNGALPVVKGNPTQLLQLMQNLVQNALKFSRESDSPRVHVGADRVADGWRITVRDNGIGIDTKHQARIFQIFQRLQPRREDSGSGIGLALCQRIVEVHGGTIGVDSQLGAGATFFFTLPDRGDT